MTGWCLPWTARLPSCTALEAHARARTCREQIDRKGLCVAGTDHQIKAHPLLGIERGARQTWLATLRALGFSKISKGKPPVIYDRFGNPGSQEAQPLAHGNAALQQKRRI